jgi:hypothetical protein
MIQYLNFKSAWIAVILISALIPLILYGKYAVDFRTKMQKVNEDEVPQYYVENSHPVIISSDVFYMVLYKMKCGKTM